MDDGLSVAGGGEIGLLAMLPALGPRMASLGEVCVETTRPSLGLGCAQLVAVEN
jgi:hypothetical protein